MVSYRAIKGSFAFICIVTGVIAVIYMLVRNTPMSIAFISVSIACLSVYLGLHSLKLGEESDKRMKVVARFAYNETVGIFEDRRLTMRDKLYKIQEKQHIDIYDCHEYMVDKTDYVIYHSFSIWKCTRYLRDLMVYEEWMEKGDEKQLIHYVTNFFNDVIEGMVFLESKITPERFDNIKGMHKTIEELKSFNEHNEKIAFQKSFKLIEKIQNSGKKK